MQHFCFLDLSKEQLCSILVFGNVRFNKVPGSPDKSWQCCEQGGCWTYSHHCQIADMKPSKGSWNGQFRGFRICVGWISTTRFVLWVFMFPTNFILFCVSSISASIFHGYHAEGYRAPSLPPRAITPVYASRLSRHSSLFYSLVITPELSRSTTHVHRVISPAIVVRIL